MAFYIDISMALHHVTRLTGRRITTVVDDMALSLAPDVVLCRLTVTIIDDDIAGAVCTNAK